MSYSADEYVMLVKMVFEGVLLPIIGGIGILGKPNRYLLFSSLNDKTDISVLNVYLIKVTGNYCMQ